MKKISLFLFFSFISVDIALLEARSSYSLHDDDEYDADDEEEYDDDNEDDEDDEEEYDDDNEDDEDESFDVNKALNQQQNDIKELTEGAISGYSKLVSAVFNKVGSWFGFGKKKEEPKQKQQPVKKAASVQKSIQAKKSTLVSTNNTVKKFIKKPDPKVVAVMTMKKTLEDQEKNKNIARKKSEVKKIISQKKQASTAGLSLNAITTKIPTASVKKSAVKASVGE